MDKGKNGESDTERIFFFIEMVQKCLESFLPIKNNNKNSSAFHMYTAGTVKYESFVFRSGSLPANGANTSICDKTIVQIVLCFCFVRATDIFNSRKC